VFQPLGDFFISICAANLLYLIYPFIFLCISVVFQNGKLYLLVKNVKLLKPNIYNLFKKTFQIVEK